VLQIEDYGLMGLVCLTAPTATDALRRLIRYHRLFTDGGELALEDDRLIWRRESGSGDGYRLLDESVLACAVAHVRQVSGRPFRPSRITFRHARPPTATATAAAAFFSCTVEYDAAVHAIVFPAETFTWVPKLANAALAEVVGKNADERLAALAAPSIAERTRQRILERLADDPAIGAIARDLGVGERTLRRRLEEHGTTFRDLVDAARRDRARDLFAEGHPLIDIAFALGFSEATALARATRRWFDATPSELRKRPNAGHPTY
jgi:AraC-like DNA-binding protein